MTTAPKTRVFARPACRHCGRKWSVTNGRRADQNFCGRCSTERQNRAATVFGHRPLIASDFDGDYLLPKFRRNPT